MIETRALRKSFHLGKGRKAGKIEAVRGVDLAVDEGEIFGFLGPNGAGKTTTLRMLSTLIMPDGGDATIAGVDLRTDPAEVRHRIGYVAQGGGTWDEVSAREELALQARMHGSERPRQSAARQPRLTPFSSPNTPTADARHIRAASGDGSTSPSGSSTPPGSCSLTSRPPAWTRRAARSCGRRYGGCARGA